MGTEKLKATASHRYRVECWKKGSCFKNGKVKKFALNNPDQWLRWVEEFDNIVVTAGLNKYLDATLKTGLAAPLWYIGLKDAGTVDPTDTLASHPGWAELTATVYTGNRPAWTPGAISGGSVSNTASKASFTITGADTLYGALMCDAASGTVGTLLGAGDFSIPRVLYVGDTELITVTCTQTAG
jgi:hypothetical protein